MQNVSEKLDMIEFNALEARYETLLAQYALIETSKVANRDEKLAKLALWIGQVEVARHNAIVAFIEHSQDSSRQVA